MRITKLACGAIICGPDKKSLSMAACGGLVKNNMNTEQALVQELARVTKERDEDRAELKRLKSQVQTHPEPSRLEIATILKAGWWSNPNADFKNEDDSWWIEQADKLIKANRQ